MSMRKFMDIINESLNGDQTIKVNLLESEDLMEAAHHAPMMAPLHELAKLPYMESLVLPLQAFEQSAQLLKRSDRQKWAATYARWALINAALTVATNHILTIDASDEENLEPVKQVLDQIIKLKNKWTPKKEAEETISRPVVFNAIREVTGHFLGYRYNPIQNYVFAEKGLSEAIRELKDLEKKMQERIRGSLEIEEDDEVFMEFPDGMTWWLLDRGYCELEGDAMGHCGNIAGNGNILSLRKSKGNIEGVEYWEPFLTFILDSGELGEMKGRANEKPAERYHPYIVGLLKDRRIRKVTGGGYLAQNNFAISDLSDEMFLDLAEARPDLIPAGVTAVMKGDQQGIEEALEVVKKKFRKAAIVGDYGVFKMHEGYKDFAEDFFTDEEWILRILDDEEYTDFTNGWSPSENDRDAIEEICDRLNATNKSFVLDWLAANLEDHEDDELHDLIIEANYNGESELYDLIRMVYDRCYERAMEDDAYDEIKKAMFFADLPDGAKIVSSEGVVTEYADIPYQCGIGVPLKKFFVMANNFDGFSDVTDAFRPKDSYDEWRKIYVNGDFSGYDGIRDEDLINETFGDAAHEIDFEGRPDPKRISPNASREEKLEWLRGVIEWNIHDLLRFEKPFEEYAELGDEELTAMVTGILIQLGYAAK